MTSDINVVVSRVFSELMDSYLKELLIVTLSILKKKPEIETRAN